MDPQRSASNNADKRQEALQKPALWCALRPPPSLLPLVMTTAMHERVIGRRWGGCPSVGSPRNRPKQALPHALTHSHCFSLTHALLPKHTHNTHTQHATMSVVAKIWDGLRTSYTRLVVGELNNYGTSCGLARPACLHSPHSLVVVVVESCLSLPEPVSLMHVREMAMVLSW